MLSVTSTRRLEIDWLYRGVGRFFPEAWARFRDFAGLAGSYRLPTDDTPPISGLLQAYSQMMEDPDIDVRSRAATEWLAWEDTVISQESNGHPGTYGNRPTRRSWRSCASAPTTSPTSSPLLPRRLQPTWPDLWFRDSSGPGSAAGQVRMRESAGVMSATRSSSGWQPRWWAMSRASAVASAAAAVSPWRVRYSAWSRRPPARW